MSTTLRRLIPILALGLPGCMGMQSQTTLDAINGAGSSLPYVEGPIEYAAPQSRWAGPSHFVLHVVAKDAGMARISVLPALFLDSFPPQGLTGSGRGPASVTTQPGLQGEQARE